MGFRFKAATRKFWADTAGIVTVQMVMFTVLLFGGVGLMMDFGRAYSAHSQMQGFIDQVALAAAEQLDGKSDSITRATSAAMAVSKSSAFTQQGAFQLHELIFMKDAPTAGNGDYSPSQAATHATTVPELARYVLARAVSSSVSAKLLNFGSDGGQTGITDIDIAASAVARSRTVSCGGLSPIVMCNPFEGSNTTSWQQQMEDGIGYRMKLTADIATPNKPSNFIGGSNALRMGLLKSPETLMEVRNTVCTDTSMLPGMATTSKSTEMLKDICMLATVEAGLSCVNDQVAYKAASPEAITTGLDVVFDMYDDGMAEILNAGSDFSFTHSFPSDLGFPSNINRSSLFYPDRVSAHGRMNRENYSLFLDDTEAEIMADPAIPPFLKGVAVSAVNARRSAYPEDSGLVQSSRQNHVFSTGQRSEWGPAPVEPCLAAENCNFYPVISGRTAGTNDVEAYAAAYYAPHLMRQMQATDPATYPNWWDVPFGAVSASALVAGNGTYYDFYANVERQNTDLLLDTATDGHTGGIIPIRGVSNPDGYGQFGIQSGAINYPATYGANAIGSEERRVQRVTVVNCDAAETYAAATGDNNPAFNDTYIGDVVDVIDVYMITPPQVASCQNAPASDPEGNNLCANEDVTEVELDVELVDAASINAVNFDSRFYAVLVH